MRVAACLLALVLALGVAAQQPAASGTHLKVGDKAPEFSLRDQDRKTVVLAFYVLAFTGG
jgi:hypothetical protein